MIKKFFYENQKYLSILGVACWGISAWSFGNMSGYKVGYEHGGTDRNKLWQDHLINEDLAEYHSKTGVWQLKSLDDVVLTGLFRGDASKAKEFLKK